MSWVCLLRNVNPDQILQSDNSAFDKKPGAGPWFAKSLFDGVKALRSSQWAAVLVQELPRRRRETRNSSQVRDIPSWECDGFGLTSDMDAQHVFVLIQKPLSHTKHGRRRNITPKKVSRCNEIFHRYKIDWSSLHIQIISNLFASKKVIGCRLLRGHVAICGK